MKKFPNDRDVISSDSDSPRDIILIGLARNRIALDQENINQLRKKLVNFLHILDTEPTRISNVVFTSTIFNKAGLDDVEGLDVDMEISVCGQALGVSLAAVELSEPFAESLQEAERFIASHKLRQVLNGVMTPPNGQTH